MNTKGIKFLAVLAVLAMAFAAFAVVAPADESDATAPSASTTTNCVISGVESTTVSSVKTITGDETGTIAAASGAAYFTDNGWSSSKALTITNASNYNYTLILGAGEVVTLGKSTGTITLYTGTGSNTAFTAYAKFVMKVETKDLKVTTSADGKTVTFDGVSGTSAVTLDGASTIAADGKFALNSTATLTIPNGKSLTNNGTVTNNSIITNNCTTDGVAKQFWNKGVIDGSGRITGTSKELVCMSATSSMTGQELTGATGNTWGVYVDQADSATITGNTFVMGQNGFAVYAKVLSGKTNKITGNIFDGQGKTISNAMVVEAAVNLTSAKVVEFTGNTFKNISSYSVATVNLTTTGSSGSITGTVSNSDTSAVFIDSTVKTVSVWTSGWTVDKDLALDLVGIYEGKTLTVAAGATLVSDVKFWGTSSKVVLKCNAIAGGAYVGTAARDGSASGALHAADLKLIAGSAADLTIESASASVDIYSNFGSISGSKIVNKEGTVKIGTSTTPMVFEKGDVVLGGTIVVGTSGAITINEGATLEVSEGATLSLSGKTLNVGESTGKNGKLIVAGAFTPGTVVNNGTIEFSDASKVFKPSSGAGEIIVAGQESTVDTSTATGVITPTAFDAADVIVFNGAVTTMEIPAGKTAVIKVATGLTAITLDAEGSSASIASVAATSNDVTVSNGTNSIIIKSGATGTITVSYGSVIINGEDFVGTIDEVQGDVTISGTVGAGDLTIKLKDGKSANVYLTDLTVPTGRTLTLDGNNGTGDNVMKAFISDEAKVTLEGTAAIALVNGVQLSISGEVVGTTGIINVGSTSKLYVDTTAVVAAQIIGSGEIYIDDAMLEMEIAKDIMSPITTTAQQKVMITNNITIYSGNYLKVAGYLEIPEGIKLTIEDGGLLEIAGPTAKALVDGDIVVKGKNGLVFNGLDLVINGNVQVKSEDAVNSAMSFAFNNPLNPENSAVLNGTITVNTTAFVNFDNLTVGAFGVVTVNGYAAGTLNNYGIVTLKGTAKAGFTVNQQGGAIFNVQSVKGTVTVTDIDMVLAKNIKVRNHIAQTDEYGLPDYTLAENVITFTDAKGLVVVSEYKVKTLSDKKNYYNYMYLSGNLGKDKDVTTDKLTIVQGTMVKVDETLNLGVVGMEISAGAEVEVNGTILATVETAGNITGNGAITVEGMVKLRNQMANTLDITAVYYLDDSGEIAYHIYTNLHDAIESGFDDFTVFGKLVISVDTTVPAGIAIVCNEILVKSGVTFTIADGAELTATGTTEVKGTFDILNRDNVSHKTVISDIASLTETTERYTNIATALEKAVAGEKIRLTKTDGPVKLTTNASIKEGVILEVPVNRTLEIAPGVTLLVGGELYLNNGDLTAGVISATSFPNDDHKGSRIFASEPTYKVSSTQTNVFSCVKLNGGEIVSTKTMSYAEYKIAGAYYTIKNKNYITTVEEAALYIGAADNKTVKVYGDVEAAYAIFAGDANESALVEFKYSSQNNFWTAGKDFTSGSIKATELVVGYGKFVFDEKYKATGTFSTENGAIALSSSTAGAAGAAAGVKTFTFGDAELSDDMVAAMEGSIDAVKIASGTVYVLKDKTLVATKDNATASKIKYLTMDAGATLNVNGSVVVSDVNTTIAGTMNVAKGATFSTGEKNLILTGTMNVAAGSTVTTKYMYIGTAPKTTSAGAALVGPEISNFDAIVVYPGASIDAEIIENLKTMTYTVEGKLYATAYAKSGSNAKIKDVINPAWTAADAGIQVSNGISLKWVYDKDNTNANEGKISDAKNVHLDVNYYIYKIIVTTEPGVDAVYLNGKLMTATGDKNKGITFEMKDLIAGTYAVSWQLANGYTDDNIELYIDGEKSTKMSVSASGVGTDPATGAPVAKNYNLVLQGVEKSGYDTHPDEDVPTEPETWTITTILLVILVILIAVMAVIVALRLNRS